MDNNTQETLQILQEECAEVIQAISKIYRFGPDQCYGETDDTNMHKLQQELGDVLVMIELLTNKGVGVSEVGLQEAKIKKFAKLRQWSNLVIKGD